MRWFFLLFILVLGCVHASSQGWDESTTWVFETQEFGPPIDGNYLVYRVTTDTLIQNQNFQKLSAIFRVIGESELRDAPSLDLFLQYEGDSVSYYDPRDERIHLIYDFSLLAGDTLDTHCPCQGEAIQVMIDSVDTIVQNGIERRRQYTSTLKLGNCQMDGQIIEGLGFNEYLLARSTFADPPPGGSIVCYSDATFSYPESTSDCNLIVSSDELSVLPLEVYPNPAMDMIYVEGVSDFDYTLYNISGELMIHDRTNKNSIDLSKVDAGLYILQIRNDKIIYTARLIKN